MDTDEASRHTQNIIARVNKQQELDELTSRMVEISSNKSQENSTEEAMGPRTDLEIGYTSNEFYLPIAGCPGVS